MSKKNISRHMEILDENSKEILAMLNIGKEPREIAQHFAVLPTAVAKWMKKRDVCQVWDGENTVYQFGPLDFENLAKKSETQQ